MKEESFGGLLVRTGQEEEEGDTWEAGGAEPRPSAGCSPALSRGCLCPPAGISRLDDQIFLNRNPGVPSVVKFHPFTPCIAVADKDSIW